MMTTQQIPLEKLILYVSMNYRGGSRYLSSSLLDDVLFLIDWTAALKLGHQLTDAVWVWIDGKGITIKDLDNRMQSSTAEISNRDSELYLRCRPWLSFMAPAFPRETKHLINTVLREVEKLYGSKLLQAVSSTYPNLVMEDNVSLIEENLDLSKLADRGKREGDWLKKADRMMRVASVL